MCDLSGTLSPQDISGLTADIEALKMRKGAQVAILMLPTTKPESIEQFALRVFEDWKPGRKGIDDGVLIVVAKSDRRVRIEIGYGLEGVLPDLITGRIIREQLMPRFKKNDYAEGLMSGLERLSNIIEGEPLPPITNAGTDFGMPTTTDLVIAAVVVIAAIIASFWIRLYLAALLAALSVGGILWFTNGPTAALFLGCLAGAITFVLPSAILGMGSSSSGSGRRGSGSGGSGGGGSSGGGGASGGY